jgi:hypothetical protein
MPYTFLNDSQGQATITVPKSLLLDNYNGYTIHGNLKDALHREGKAFLNLIGKHLGLYFQTRCVRGFDEESGHVTLDSESLWLKLYEPTSVSGLFLCFRAAGQERGQMLPMTLLADEDAMYRWLGQMKFLIRQAMSAHAQTVWAKPEDDTPRFAPAVWQTLTTSQAGYMHA